MKKTFKELRNIDSIYGKYISLKNFTNTKLEYAFKKFLEKNLIPVYKEYNDGLELIRIDNALTEKDTGAILYADKEDTSNRKYKYSKEGLKKVIKGENEYASDFDLKEFEIEPYICKDTKPFTFTDDEKEVLKGVII